MSETVNEQLRGPEILPTDTQEYMKNIHSVQGERGEGARVTGRGPYYHFATIFITHFATVTTWIDVEGAMMRM